MAPRYSGADDTDFFRAVVHRPSGNSYFAPYDTVGAAKTRGTSAQFWQQEKYPVTVQQLVAVLDPDDLIAVLEWQDVAKKIDDKWINV